MNSKYIKSLTALDTYTKGCRDTAVREYHECVMQAEQAPLLEQDAMWELVLDMAITRRGWCVWDIRAWASVGTTCPWVSVEDMAYALTHPC